MKIYGVAVPRISAGSSVFSNRLSPIESPQFGGAIHCPSSKPVELFQSLHVIVCSVSQEGYKWTKKALEVISMDPFQRGHFYRCSVFQVPRWWGPPFF